eukprot:CAMPEP_0202082676 /NCGR_PEP_ID=MMETSP0964-20121228/20282_1 /ASSEMBLY_ACC=CAM_ASM_000500 /TAXON_ID=4773 /ORGANISM="Schizochytrium aggregatum, Strain ATCC28209" /LENGTH=99 /DNA_ID=CAMNT_0048650321 /DNA_START=1 /DNA_END=297 /DNA_ORIENTATION=-
MQESPAGFLAHLLEKFAFCTDLVEKRDFTPIYTTFMVLWGTHSVTSCIRLYRETMFSNEGDKFKSYLNIPTGLISTPYEPLQSPRSILELSFNVCQYTV